MQSRQQTYFYPPGEQKLKGQTGGTTIANGRSTPFTYLSPTEVVHIQTRSEGRLKRDSVHNHIQVHILMEKKGRLGGKSAWEVKLRVFLGRGACLIIEGSNRETGADGKRKPKKQHSYERLKPLAPTAPQIQSRHAATHKKRRDEEINQDTK